MTDTIHNTILPMTDTLSLIHIYGIFSKNLRKTNHAPIQNRNRSKRDTVCMAVLVSMSVEDCKASS